MGSFRAGTGQYRKKKASMSFLLSLLPGTDPLMTSEQMSVKTCSVCDLTSVYEPGCKHSSNAGGAGTEVSLQKET